MIFKNPNISHTTACLDQRTLVVRVAYPNSGSALSVVFTYGDYGSTPNLGLLTPEVIEEWVSKWETSDIIKKENHNHSPSGDYAMWYSLIAGVPLNISIESSGSGITCSHIWCDWLPEHLDMDGYPAINLQTMRFFETTDDIIGIFNGDTGLRQSDGFCFHGSNRKYAQLVKDRHFTSVRPTANWVVTYKRDPSEDYLIELNFLWDFPKRTEAMNVIAHYDPFFAEHTNTVSIIKRDLLPDDPVAAMFLTSVVEAGGKWSINHDGMLVCDENAYVIAKAIG